MINSSSTSQQPAIQPASQPAMSMVRLLSSVIHKGTKIYLSQKEGAKQAAGQAKHQAHQLPYNVNHNVYNFGESFPIVMEQLRSLMALEGLERSRTLQ